MDCHKPALGACFACSAKADTFRIGWRGIWDDLVALAVLDPQLFENAGTHFEPAVTRDVVVASWQKELSE